MLLNFSFMSSKTELICVREKLTENTVFNTEVSFFIGLCITVKLSSLLWEHVLDFGPALFPWGKLSPDLPSNVVLSTHSTNHTTRGESPLHLRYFSPSPSIFFTRQDIAGICLNLWFMLFLFAYRESRILVESVTLKFIWHSCQFLKLWQQIHHKRLHEINGILFAFFLSILEEMQ